ncbi:MAG: GNAT family N-acetyltransferase [Lachnospiraceae bacterium]
MSGTMGVHIREMQPEDYDQIYDLWISIKGFGIRTVDDSREGVTRFIRRNPTTSVVAVQNGRIVGSILCGHDGRRGCFYHVCVAPDYRQHGIGERLAKAALEALRKEGISKVNLIAFKDNLGGNAFWNSIGWSMREDLNYYEITLNQDNITNFVI